MPALETSRLESRGSGASTGTRNAIDVPETTAVPHVAKIPAQLCVNNVLLARGLENTLRPHDDIEIVSAGRMSTVCSSTRAVAIYVAPADGGRLTRLPGPAQAIVVVEPENSHHCVLDAIRLGFRGFVSVESVDRQLPIAIRSVAKDRAFVAPALAGPLLDWLAHQLPVEQPAVMDATERLTDREAEVLRLLGGGASNGAIASELCISEATARSHVYHIMTKLDLGSRSQAVLYGYQFQFRPRPVNR